MRLVKVEEINVVNVEDIMPRLASTNFRTTVKYTGALEHQYIMSHWRDDYLNLWLDMRQLIATQGVVRPFFKSKQIWKYVDLPDGFTYWVMPEWVTENWDEAFDHDDNYVLNRQETEHHQRIEKGFAS